MNEEGALETQEGQGKESSAGPRVAAGDRFVGGLAHSCGPRPRMSPGAALEWQAGQGRGPRSPWSPMAGRPTTAHSA